MQAFLYLYEVYQMDTLLQSRDRTWLSKGCYILLKIGIEISYWSFQSNANKVFLKSPKASDGSVLPWIPHVNGHQVTWKGEKRS